MISHVVVFFGLAIYPPYRIIHESSVLISVQTYLYNQSCCCPIFFYSLTKPYQIGYDSLALFLVKSGPVRSVTLLSCLIFVIDYTYTISRIVVLFGFRDRSHSVRLIMIVQFRFRRRPHLYVQSHCYPIIDHTLLDWS